MAVIIETTRQEYRIISKYLLNSSLIIPYLKENKVKLNFTEYCVLRRSIVYMVVELYETIARYFPLVIAYLKNSPTVLHYR